MKTSVPINSSETLFLISSSAAFILSPVILMGPNKGKFTNPILEIKSSASLNCIPIMVGGPVQMDQGFVLHRDKVSNWEACIEVSDEILLTTSQDILFSIAEDQGPKETLIALGYAGWSPGQLEEELAKNSWLIMPADSDIIFSTPYDQRFSQAAAQIGVDMNLISSQIGHA